MRKQEAFTFVVDIGGQLDITVGCVHQQVIEMLIWFQNEFIPKLHIIVIFILIINQERVVVIKLLVKTMGKRKTKREWDRLLPALLGKTLFKNKEGTYGESELQRGSK